MIDYSKITGRRERLNALADFIEALPDEGFYMEQFGVTCDEEIAADLDIADSYTESDAAEAEMFGIDEQDEIWALDARDIVRLREVRPELNTCNTAMCVAGWTCYLWAPEVDARVTCPEINARRILDLSDDIAHDTFHAYSKTRVEMVGHLRGLAQQLQF